MTIDGPGGAGKTTTTRDLHHQLTRRGYAVHTTTEPSRAQLGEIARHGTDTYSGHALACLVAADRYHHLATEIRPQLAAGRIVLCDRYVASSYGLQRMDGVPIAFIEAINTAAETPDLAVILTADPEVTARRIDRRGAHSRFEAGVTTSQAEAELYTDTTRRLTERGYPILAIDTAKNTTSQVNDLIIRRVVQLAATPTDESPTA
ncbi:dTMP kinase [Saccharothrix sp. ALI-22-I]|uniref:dTMP kinase n=1 Tax=Saccharothrix sp. ALI-22-I TaxID=1933778 RepID=UPI001EE6E458|nr:dTMP kinase [Saccharothrix sp. ALI-22-I]